jgi:hypothetical protein
MIIGGVFFIFIYHSYLLNIAGKITVSRRMYVIAKYDSSLRLRVYDLFLWLYAIVSLNKYLHFKRCKYFKTN